MTATFTAVHPVTRLSYKRTSMTRTYTHAILADSGPVTWCGSLELARVQLGRAAASPWHINPVLVPVTNTTVAPVRVSPKERNATQRAVITRKLNRLRRGLIHSEDRLAVLRSQTIADRPVMVANHGAERVAEIIASEVASQAAWVQRLHDDIAHLQDELAALLAQRG